MEGKGTENAAQAERTNACFRLEVLEGIRADAGPRGMSFLLKLATYFQKRSTPHAHPSTCEPA